MVVGRELVLWCYGAMRQLRQRAMVDVGEGATDAT
jgi:hypothetical protein